MHIEEIKSRLAEQRADILETFHVKKIGVFGSVVRNKQTRRSDVDILVNLKRDIRIFSIT